MNTIRKIIIVQLILILFFAMNTYGEDNTPPEKLHLMPAIKYQTEYNDNIFLDREKEDDFIHLISPGLEIRYDNAPHFSIQGGYALYHYTYSDFNKNNYDEHLPHISIDFSTPTHFYGRLEDVYLKTANPYGTDDNYGEGEKTRRSRNKAALSVGYEVSGRFSIEGELGMNALWFSDVKDQWQNRNDHIYRLSIMRALTPKTSFVMSYQYVSSEYKKQNDGIGGWTAATSQDYSKNKYMMGFHVDPRGKINGRLFVGYETRDPENRKDKNDNAYTDFDTWVAEIDITYNYRPTDHFKLILEKKIHPSNLSEASSYTDTSFSFGYTRRFSHAFELSIQSGMEIWDYNMIDEHMVPEQKYTIVRTDAGLRYFFKDWLTTEIHYIYKTREATKELYNLMEYDNNVFYLSLSAHF